MRNFKAFVALMFIGVLEIMSLNRQESDDEIKKIRKDYNENVDIANKNNKKINETFSDFEERISKLEGKKDV